MQGKRSYMFYILGGLDEKFVKEPHAGTAFADLNED